jgi:hypothetical protein
MNNLKYLFGYKLKAIFYQGIENEESGAVVGSATGCVDADGGGCPRLFSLPPYSNTGIKYP